MYGNDISLLQANLTEITIAAVEADRDKLQEIPVRVAYIGRVCHRRSWRVFIDECFGTPQSPEIFKPVITETLTTLFNRVVINAVYEAHCELMHNWVGVIEESLGIPDSPERRSLQEDRYRAYVKDAVGEYAVALNLPEKSTFVPADFSKVDELKELITSCSQATREFWELWKNKSEESLLKYLIPLVPEGPWVIHSDQAYRSFRQIQSMIDLEGKMRCDTPIALLSKIHLIQTEIKNNPEQLAKVNLAEALTKKEKEQFDEWLKQLHLKKDEVTWPILEEALMEVAAIITIQSGVKTSVEELIMELSDLEFTLFTEEDDDYMEWRDGLVPGNTIPFGKEFFTLGEELLGAEEAQDQHRVFTLIGQPNYVIVIGRNRFQLMIESARSSIARWHWGSKFVDLPTMDSEKHQHLTERLMVSLNAVKWTSENFELDPEDVHKALVVANHVYCMCERNATPENLDAKFFMFNKEGLLKSTKLMPLAGFDYNKLEAFCCTVADQDKDPFVLDFIMHVSGLVGHPVACFYRDVVSQTFITGQMDWNTVRQDAKHVRNEYNTHVKQLCEIAIKMREDVTAIVRSKLRAKDRARLDELGIDYIKKCVGEQLAKIYQASSTPGALKDEIVKSMRKQAVQQVLNQLLKKEVQADPDRESYYAGMRALMESYNRAMLNKPAQPD